MNTSTILAEAKALQYQNRDSLIRREARTEVIRRSVEAIRPPQAT
jgi:hypothetical protein